MCSGSLLRVLMVIFTLIFVLFSLKFSSAFFCSGFKEEESYKFDQLSKW